MTRHYCGGTHPGMVRANNEDRFFVQPVLQGTMLGACVIDGVGGYEGGEVAAAIAHDVLLHYLSIPSGPVPQMLTEAMLAANDRIVAERRSQAHLADMACVATLVLVDEAGNQVFFTHVGDTRLYLFRDGSLVKLTRDQSFVGFLEDSGKLSEADAMHHLKRNEIDKALGFDPRARQTPDFLDNGTAPFLPGDLLLLCSDGLTDLVNRAAIQAVLTSSSSLQEKTDALIAAANSAGGKDNITVVLVQHRQKRKQHKAVSPKKRTAAKQVAKGKTARKSNKEQNQVPVTAIVPGNKKRRWWPLALLIGLPLITGIAIWLYVQPAEKEPVSTNNKAVLLRLLQQGNDTITWNDTTVVEIAASDTLLVNQDSLVILGNGLHLKADSTQPGNGLLLGPRNKYLAMQDVVLEGFNTGIEADSQVLHLQRVRFANCLVPVAFGTSVPVNSPSLLLIEDSFFTRTDTLKRR